MYIETTLRDLGSYIKEEIISGNFKLIHTSECVATIRLENRYNFGIWIGNDPKINLNFYDSFIAEGNIEKGLDISFNSKKEKLLVWSTLKPMIDKYKKEVVKKELEEQAAEIQEKLNELNNE